MNQESREHHTVIVGGGLAGLAAAAALAARGVRVTLLESRPRLGGRASSFVDQATGTVIDNCQHVVMGCCTNYLALCDELGLSEFFRRERELYFIGPGGTVCPFRASRLPAPLHLFPAFRRLDYLTGADRRRLANGLRSLARWNPDPADRRSFADWLREHHQPEHLIDRFWTVVLVSALSETLDRIDIGQARKVFMDGFLRNRHGWEVIIPTVPLDELYGDRLQQWFAARGTELQLRAGVERLEIDGDRCDAAVLRDGQRMTADSFVLATPFHITPRLLPESVRSNPTVRGLDELETAAISSVHLWFDRPFTTLPHAVFTDRISQWFFNRSVLQSARPREDGEGAESDAYCQVVISDSGEIAKMPQEKLIGAVVDELAGVWPEVRESRLVHQRVVTEHRAVFSVTPGSDELRPGQQSPIANLQFAGDWTQTGWPSTMEGAVRSGFLAAENVLRQIGQPVTIVSADLPTAFLSRWLLGL